jgi:acyl-CoA thioester hydrolase
MSADPAADALAGFPVTVEIPVAWAEMDVFGHVNNTVFLRWFESARIEYLRRIGLADAGPGVVVGPIVHSTHCRFRRPVIFPDRVLAGARVTEVSEDRFVMEYRVTSRAQGAVVADGGAVVVAYDYVHASKTPLPAAVREAIERLEG